MFRLFGLLLVGLAVSVFTAASAHAVTCERTTHTHIGFVNKGAFESWFPKTLHLNDRKFVKKAENSKQLVQKYKKITWSLLPNGKLVGSWEQQAGFRQVDPVRYKCDKTSIQIASGNTGGSTSVASSTPTQTNTPKLSLGDNKFFLQYDSKVDFFYYANPKNKWVEKVIKNIEIDTCFPEVVVFAGKKPPEALPGGSSLSGA